MYIVNVHCDTIRPFGYERVYLPLCKVANTPFLIQWDELLAWNVRSYCTCILALAADYSYSHITNTKTTQKFAFGRSQLTRYIDLMLG